MAEKITIKCNENSTKLSELLTSYIQSGNINFLIGSGASCPAINTAGDIEEEINKLLQNSEETEANLKALSLIEKIHSVHEELENTEIDDKETIQTLKGYTDFIKVIDNILFERKNSLLPRQANIFTTNYDLFLEHASYGQPSIILNDGFDRTANLGNKFVFAPERFFDRIYRSGTIYNYQTEVPTINLIKLHGSLSWQREEQSIINVSDILSELDGIDKSDNKQVEAFIQKLFLILPNLKKFHSTMLDRIYYDLLRIFSNTMERENSVLISFGFSFSDEHILDITHRVLRNPTAQLIIFSFSEKAAMTFEEKFSKQRNVLIVSPPTNENIQFSELNDYLFSVLKDEKDD